MIITTTPTVEGYLISDYLGPVTGAATYLIGGIIGEGLSNSSQASYFSNAYSAAESYMEEHAYGADAIVGVQHTLCGVANGYMVVSVTGTAVTLIEDPSFHIKIEQVKQQEIEKQARREEAARRLAEEHQREHQREEELKNKEQKERIKQYLISLENDQLIQVPSNEEERKRLIDELTYAGNMSLISKMRTKLKQIDIEVGKEIIEFLLSLPDDELKPTTKIILKKLKGEE